MTTFDSIARRNAEIARHRENRARLAHVFAEFRTKGQGSSVFKKRVRFGLAFVERPNMSAGCWLDFDDYCETIDLDPDEVAIPLPSTTQYVIDWDIDPDGLYTGAYCAARVDLPPEIDPMLKVEIWHNFHFAGEAIKDVDPELGDE